MPKVDLGAISREAALATPRAERGCPVPDELAELAAGGLASERREALLRHIELCPDCALEATAASEAARIVEESLPLRGRRFGRLGVGSWSPAARRGFALAASLVLALTAVVAYRATVEPADELRNGAASAWRTDPVDGATLVSAPRFLAWTTPIAATEFRVTLFDAAFSPLASSGAIAVPRFELSTDLPLERGKTYFWRVELLGVAGRDGARTFSFGLAP